MFFSGATIFHVCKTDKDCMVNHTFCNTTMSQCDCQRDYILSSSKKECLKSNDDQSEYSNASLILTSTMREFCTGNEECAHVSGAVCTSSDVCDCPQETVISEDGKRCLKVARDIQDECVENVQCAQTFEKAVCVNQTCHCEDRYHFEPEMKRCFNNRVIASRFVGLDETCGNTFDCYQDENDNVTSKTLKCEKNVCVCAENYEREHDRCVNEGSLQPVLSVFLVFFVIYVDLAI
ncbi:hypothetical protein E2986_11556 [Frieseomelitta varia]|uniref:EB domain-containing protein n=1 Tax=Frieseomelitta varia TaxID=561572 RepID=A0A833W2B7_9HYME|nr:hypothetical protein E2986_11556 [Frieseomelitta varia]